MPLTLKLRGRPEVPDARGGPTLTPRPRPATTQAVHGPLQRLLDGAFTKSRR
jgi:hypothetical protein